MVYDSYPILVTVMFPLLSHINPYYPISIHCSSHYGIALPSFFQLRASCEATLPAPGSSMKQNTDHPM